MRVFLTLGGSGAALLAAADPGASLAYSVSFGGLALALYFLALSALPRRPRS